MTTNPISPHSADKPAPAPAPVGASSRRWIWAVLLLLLFFMASVRFHLRDLPLERDEGEYAYAGQLILQGIPPYSLAYNMKFPGTYVAYALLMATFGQTPAGIHLGFILINGAAIILVYFLTARLLCQPQTPPGSDRGIHSASTSEPSCVQEPSLRATPPTSVLDCGGRAERRYRFHPPEASDTASRSNPSQALSDRGCGAAQPQQPHTFLRTDPSTAPHTESEPGLQTASTSANSPPPSNPRGGIGRAATSSAASGGATNPLPLPSINHPAALAAAAIYTCLSLSQALLGTAAHATHFVIVPALAGLLLLLRATDSRSKTTLFFSGLLLGLCVLMKQPGLFFVLFACAFLLYLEPRPVDWPHFGRQFGIFALGLLTPAALMSLWLWRAGVFGKFWFWTINYAREYATEYPGAWFTFQRLLNRTPPAVAFLLCASVLGLVILWRKADHKTAVFASGLLAVSVAAVFPSFNFWPHYFILLLPAASLLAGAAVAFASQWLHARPLRWTTALPGAALAALLAWGVIRERTLFFLSTPIEACHLLYGWNPFPESIQIGEYLRTHSSPDARIAVLGSEPQIYFFAHRHSATGFLYTYGLMEDQAFAERMQREMISEIESNRPEYVVWVEIATSWGVRPTANPLIFDWSEKYVNDHYQRVGVVDIFAGQRTDIRWDADAARLPPQSLSYLSIFKRKELAR